MHGDLELAAGSGGSKRRLSRWHSARAFLRRAAATLGSGSSMLLAVQKSLAETMKGCNSAMVGKAKAIQMDSPNLWPKQGPASLQGPGLLSGHLGADRDPCASVFDRKKIAAECVQSVRMAGTGLGHV